MTTFRKLLSKESIKRHLQDYCENTTIHGFKYIGEKGRHRVERIWWIFVFGLSMAGSAYLINKVWHKWQNLPVMVSFSDKLTPVWQIPFPAVTICNEVKTRQNIFNFTYAMYSSNLTEDEQKKKDDVSLLCGPFIELNNSSKFTNESTIDMIKKLAPQFDEMMLMCKWKTYVVNCYDLFTPILTEDGLCFSFNILFSTEMYRDIVVQSYIKYNKITNLDWSLEKGYDISAMLETEPHRALGAGNQAGINIVLRAYEYDMDYACRGPVQGFKILLHNPAEIPRLKDRYFKLANDQELILSVKPNMMTTSEGLRSYQPSSRQCYFPSERHLAYFKIYTQRNCEFECLANYTLKKCQCAAFHMPRFDSTRELCGAGSKQCMRLASGELKMGEFLSRIYKIQTPENACNCLPACVTLQYDAETSQAHFNWFNMYSVRAENMSKFDRVQISRVSIYFKDDQFITSIRSELYGVADFLATCGGLLGLFSGISVLSLIEIIYYITLRFYSNMKSQSQNTQDNTANHQRHLDVFKLDPTENKNYNRIILFSYKKQQ